MNELNRYLIMKPVDGKRIIPLSNEYTTYCVWVESMSDEKRQRLTKRVVDPVPVMLVEHTRKYMEDEEVREALREYDNYGFENLPNWLQCELIARDLPHERRMPTEFEQWETVSDAREHRIVNKELTVKDYLNHYTGKRDYNHV